MKGVVTVKKKKKASWLVVVINVETARGENFSVFTTKCHASSLREGKGVGGKNGVARLRELEREERRGTDATGNGNTPREDPTHRGPTQRGGPRRGPTTGGEGHTGDPHRTHTDKLDLLMDCLVADRGPRHVGHK